MADFNQLWIMIIVLDPPFIALIVTIMRNLWTRKNDFVFNNCFKPPLRVVQIVKANLEEFTKATKPKQHNQSILRREAAKWIPPEHGLVKAS